MNRTKFLQIQIIDLNIINNYIKSFNISSGELLYIPGCVRLVKQGLYISAIYHI